MADPQYKEIPFLFQSQGVIARKVDDATDPHEFANLDNLEELAEGAFGTRLGSTVNNSTGVIGGSIYPLDGPVVSLSKLAGLNGNAWRYAVTDAGTLWRRNSLTPGAYSSIETGLSGNPIWIVASAPSPQLNTPTAFFADSTQMMKDNGTLSSPSQMGIFQPQFPIQAQAQPPSLVTLDNFVTASTSYSTTGSITLANTTYVNTTLASAVTATGIQEVTIPVPYTVSANKAVGLFQLLTIDTGGNQEVVLVLFV